VTLPVHHFLLVPDSGAARRLRRALASEGARVGVVVGTWLELLEQARAAYLLPAPADWDDALRAALAAVEDAFWQRSLEVAPAETAAAVAEGYRTLVAASDLHAPLPSHGLDALPERAARHCRDLARLQAALGDRLPPDLALARALLADAGAGALRSLRVYRLEGLPQLGRNQRALVDALNARAASGADDADADLERCLERTFADAPDDATPAALATLQRHLFSDTAAATAADDSVQWLGVRDPLEEAEVAAGMVQRLLDEHAELAPADVGLLLPRDEAYAAAVADAFARAGLPLSGLPAERKAADLGREALLHFLLCRERPAPAMALAALLASPLMPWPRATGTALAARVMEGRYELVLADDAPRAWRRMVALIRGTEERPQALAKAIAELVSLLRRDDTTAAHAGRAADAAAAVAAALHAAERVDWKHLRRLASPTTLLGGDETQFTQEGVTVLAEHREPWRAVRHLIVLGFAAGRYPAPPARSPVFSPDDLQAIRAHAGLEVTTPAGVLAERRALLRRQLAVARASTTFLVPRRDALGAAIAPSDTLVFAHRLLGGEGEPAGLVLDLDAEAGRAAARAVALAPPADPVPPRPLASADPDLGRNLLGLRKDDEGRMRPQSPSSLERLLVSPLAWLIERCGAKPVAWAPEEPDPATRGSLAHEVFEHLFPAGAWLPDGARIRESVPALLEQAMRKVAPFLRGAQWRVERRHLTRELTDAALAWRRALAALGAEVAATEVWLEGRFQRIPVHGRADAILALPDARLLVVDYKKSKSGNRHDRMAAGYDVQATVYRRMLETGGPTDDADGEAAARLANAATIGILYYTLNDHALLADGAVAGAGTVPGWRTVDGDVSDRAVALLRDRLRQVRAGVVRLNREGDEAFFEKEAKLRPYAIRDVSPLVPLFLVPDDAEEGAP